MFSWYKITTAQADHMAKWWNVKAAFKAVIFNFLRYYNTEHNLKSSKSRKCLKVWMESAAQCMSERFIFKVK